MNNIHEKEKDLSKSTEGKKIKEKEVQMMKNEQTKKSATVADMVNALKQLMKDNLVGLVMESEDGLTFALPNGQAFLISVKNAEQNA